jgi:hypothetical protein
MIGLDYVPFKSRYIIAQLTITGYWIPNRQLIRVIESVRPVKPISKKSTFRFGLKCTYSYFPEVLFGEMVPINHWNLIKMSAAQLKGPNLSGRNICVHRSPNKIHADMSKQQQHAGQSAKIVRTQQNCLGPGRKANSKRTRRKMNINYALISTWTRRCLQMAVEPTVWRAGRDLNFMKIFQRETDFVFFRISRKTTKFQSQVCKCTGWILITYLKYNIFYTYRQAEMFSQWKEGGRGLTLTIHLSHLNDWS